MQNSLNIVGTKLSCYNYSHTHIYFSNVGFIKLGKTKRSPSLKIYAGIILLKDLRGREEQDGRKKKVKNVSTIFLRTGGLQSFVPLFIIISVLV